MQRQVGGRDPRPVASASPAHELSLYPTGKCGEPLHTSGQAVTCAKLVEGSTAIRTVYLMEALGRDGGRGKSEPMSEEGIRAWAGCGDLRKQVASTTERQDSSSLSSAV